MPVSPDDVQMVKMALQEKAPHLYRTLKLKGQLETFALDQAQTINEAVTAAIAATLASPEYKKERYLDRARLLAEAQRNAREAAIAVVLEFPDVEAPTTTGSAPGTPTP